MNELMTMLTSFNAASLSLQVKDNEDVEHKNRVKVK